MPEKSYVLSDHFLKKQGFLENIRKLKPKSRVVIIGGSHSGFSCAWLLLNGPATANHNSVPFANRKVQKQCKDCCICKQARVCPCVCKCFGYFKHDQWPKNFVLTEVTITILYRDKIKVFYKNVKEAHESGYYNFETQDKDGYVYAYTGLRGDAK